MAVVMEGVAVEEEASASTVLAVGRELVARAVGKAGWAEALVEQEEGEPTAAAVVSVEGEMMEAAVLEMAKPVAEEEVGEWRPVGGVQEDCQGHRLCRGPLGMLWLRVGTVHWVSQERDRGEGSGGS